MIRADVWQALTRDPAAVAGLVVLAVLVTVAVTGKVVTDLVPVLDPAAVRLVDKLRAPLSSPSPALEAELHPALGIYLLGTDDLGRDLLARMLQGSVVSLSIGFVAMGIAVVVGVILGALAGFYGERRLGPVSVDAVIMRFTDIMLCFPSFFLVLTVIALLPPNIHYIMAVLGLTGWGSDILDVIGALAEFLSES